MAKYFVLDTNVLIHNPKSIYSFADNTVVIPLIVIEELDKFKTSADKRGMHARHVLKELDLLTRKGAINRGAKLGNGGRLFIHLGSRIKRKTALVKKVADNEIILIALELQKKNDIVFFISKDVNARVKAEALGIKARDYEKQKVDYQKIYYGWRKLEVDDEKVDQFYQNGEMPAPETLQGNEYALIQSTSNPKKSALSTYSHSQQRLELFQKEFEAMGIKPLNVAQRFAFDLLLNPRIELVTLVGTAGTGKTLISIACALKQVLEKNAIYEKLLIARPIIPMGKDIGYLPGEKDQKLRYWMQPIFDNLDYILKSSNPQSYGKEGEFSSIEYLTQSKMIEVEALTYIRGRSIPNQFLIVDEAQNLTPHEVKTIISRAGKHTKIVLTGDPEQIDNPYLDANSNGLTYIVDRLKGENLFGHIFLDKSERSDLATLAVEKL